MLAPERQDAGIWCLAGCSPEERKAFKEKLDLGMVDVFRYFKSYKKLIIPGLVIGLK